MTIVFNQQDLLIDSLHGLYPPMTEDVEDEKKFELYIETLLQKRVKDEEQERRFLGIINKDQPLLAAEKVRSTADAVALVAAETREAARAALAAIAVTDHDTTAGVGRCQAAGRRQVGEGAREFRHHLDEVFNGLIAAGFVIRQVVEALDLAARMYGDYRPKCIIAHTVKGYGVPAWEVSVNAGAGPSRSRARPASGSSCSPPPASRSRRAWRSSACATSRTSRSAWARSGS